MYGSQKEAAFARPWQHSMKPVCNEDKGIL